MSDNGFISRIKKFYDSRIKKINNPLLKNKLKGLEQIFLQRRYKCPLGHKKMMNTIIHQGNANQSHNEIPPHIHQDRYNLKGNKCWQGCREIGAFIHCKQESKMVQPLWKTDQQYLKISSIKLPYDLAISFLGIYPREMKRQVHTHSSTTFNIPKVQTTQMCIN